MSFNPFVPTVQTAPTPLPVSLGGTGAATAAAGLAALGGATLWDTQPSDNGLLAWTFNIDDASQTNVLTAGSVYLAKIPIRTAITATNLWFNVSSAGVGTSSGSFVGLYNSAGTLLTGSADIGAGSLLSTGSKSVALTSAQALAAGTFVWATILVNLATTQPGLRCSISSAGASAPNTNLTAATFRFAINGTAQTTLPASITPSSNAQAGNLPLWIAAN